MDLEEVEFFHNLANCPAADLFDNSNAMIGIDDFIAYVEIAVDADHEGTPTSAGHLRNNTHVVYPNRLRKAIQKPASYRQDIGSPGRVHEGARQAKAPQARGLTPEVRRPGFIIPKHMTDQIKRKLQEEMNTLEHELVHELPKEIKKAAALGDLSENAEYHMAKQRQEFVKARLRQLGARMAELALINMDNIPKDKIGLGSTVRVYDNSKNAEVEYKLVTSEESDVTAGKISTSSPIGRALLNKKVGDTAAVTTPNGHREMEILSLTTIHEQPEAK
jgi:transcription elongation factor GreA